MATNEQAHDAQPTKREEPSTFPATGRLLGLDYGTKRIGLAVSDDEQRLACPLQTCTRTVEAADADFLRRVIADYTIVGIVVGLPVHMSGDEGQKAREARDFGEWVATVTDRPVVYWDERLSTAAADVRLHETGLSPARRAGLRDQVAAQVILQSFLDAEDRGQAPHSVQRPALPRG